MTILGFLSEFYEIKELIYDKLNDGYKFIGPQEKSSTEFEFLVITKILFWQRGPYVKMRWEQLKALQYELPKHSQDRVKHLIDNEFSLSITYHNMAIIKMCWDLGQCILRKGWNRTDIWETR